MKLRSFEGYVYTEADNIYTAWHELKDEARADLERLEGATEALAGEVLKVIAAEENT